MKFGRMKLKVQNSILKMAVKPKKLRIVSYNYQQYKRKFKQEKQKLLRLLDRLDCEIEHFGSTAVKGTIGKGIIDILIALPNKKSQDKALQILQKEGYRQGELSKKPDGRIFLCSNQEQSEPGDIHIHLVLKNSKNHLNPLIFRNFLIKHKSFVKKYNVLKKQLAEKMSFNRKQYTKSKKDFIDKVTKLAANEFSV